MISTVKPDEDITECETISDLAALLDLDLKTLLFFAYRNNRLYNHYKIPKKSGGHRDIDAPKEALKTVCSKLNFYLSNVYDEFLPKSVQGFVRGRGIITNADKHLNRAYVLNIDLDDFFGTINSGRIIGLFRRYPFRFGTRLASVLTGIVTYNNHLPQGSPTSPVLANMICLKLDKALMRLSQENGWRYSRYADDITFSTNKLTDDLASVSGTGVVVGKRIINILKKNGFALNEKKTRLAIPGQSKWVTGVKVNKERNLSRKYIKRIRCMLHAWEAYTEAKAETEFNQKYNRGPAKTFREVLRGRIDHLGNVRKKTDPLYIKLYNRLCALEEKYNRRLPESKKEEYARKTLVIQSSTGGYGSGFFINSNVIVTCAHVVGDDKSVRFTTLDQTLPMEFAHATVQEVNVEKDFAILYTASDYSPLVLPCNHRKQLQSFSNDEEYISIGYGGFRQEDGYWTDPATLDQKIAQKYRDGSLRVNNPMWRGMSGGPVISKRTNRVDGYIVHGSMTLADGEDVKSHLFYPISNVPSDYFFKPVSLPDSGDILF